MENKILELFQEICKPFKDKEGGEKLEVIKEWLEKRNIQYEYEAGIGLIINKQESPRTILVSHMDLIHKFQKGFGIGDTFEIVTIDNEDLMSKLPKNNISNKIVRGALDNTVTNACALLCIEELIENDITDVEVLLSEGEEVGLIGMSGYLKKNKDKSLKAFFVNLDVTNDGWGKSISVEYDKPDYLSTKKIKEILSDLDPHLQGERFCDDTDAINSAGCAGLSYCIPTNNTIHSYKNYCSYDSIDPYYKGLYIMLKELERHENYKRFDNSYFKKALKSESEEDFDKRVKKAEKKEAKRAGERRSSWDTGYLNNSYKEESSFNFESKYKSNRLQSYNENDYNRKEYPNLTNYQISERKSFIQETTDYFVFQQKIEEPTAIYYFIKEAVMTDSMFDTLSMSEVFKIDEIRAQEMCKDLVSYGVLLEEGDTEFKFPAPEFANF